MQIREIIDKLSKIDREILLRKQDSPLSRYNVGDKIHKKQMEFHKCLKKNRWVFGGNRTGKTECGAVETVWLARGIHPYRENRKNVDVWVVSLSLQVQRDVAQGKILYYLDKRWIEDIVMVTGRKQSPEYGVIDTIVIKNVFGGTSKIGFKSCDQGREKFQGTSLDYVWFDEEPPLDIYNECKMRVLDRRGEVYGTMTPLKGLTWMYDEIYLNKRNNDNVWYTHMSWKDNPFLNADEIKEFESNMSEDELRSRRDGEFMSVGGMVYGEFDENIHVIEPFKVPPEWYDTMSIDPGLNNPLSCHWYAVDFDGNVYVIAEHYEAKRDIVYHSERIKEICKNLNWPVGFNGQYNALIDSAANQRTLASQKNVAELFYDYGITVNPNVVKDLFSGIQRVKAYLKDANGKAKLFIFKNCRNLIREIKGYFWGDNDAPIKKDDHALDELRYYIMSKPQKPDGFEFKSELQRNKERLMRLNKNNKKRFL